MAGRSFFSVARWALTRLLVALLVALAGSVAAVQLGGGDDVAETASEPRIGQHWHAAYAVFICGERQPNFRLWQGGVHTHDDGIIHIHPVVPSEEGEGASLGKWFEYGGGLLTESEMRMPGSRRTFENGNECPDGQAGELQVIVNGRALDDWTGYIPQHGDQVIIAFGPRPDGRPSGG
jgi:hypothetical protein